MVAPTRLTDGSIITSTTNQISADLGGDEIAILALQDNWYYGLRAVGTYIWETVSSPCSLAQLVDGVVSRYEVDRARATSDVTDFVLALHRRGLVDIN